MRRLTLTFAICGLLVVPAAARADPAWVPGRVVVQLEPHAASVKAVAAAAGTPAQTVTAVPASPAQVIQLRPGQSVLTAVARLNRRADVRYAVPDYIGRASGEWLPDDPGRGRTRGGWRKVQWNFLGATGINAPVAWWNLIRAGHPGGRGVRIAVVDTGVAYKTFGRWKRSPDFNRTRFAAGWDFVGNDSHPYDFNGHGTHVAGTIAESTNNGISLTGIAYGATIMPVRVLDRDGLGDAATIAKGIVWAVKHGAQIVNLSIEFDVRDTAADIPEIIDAVRYAHAHGVLVVAAAGNDRATTVAYPARSSDVLSVGATTRDGCLADYSNDGTGLDLVAPGGGNDTFVPGDRHCRTDGGLGSPIYQMTFRSETDYRFGLPGDYYGTSMAAAHVSAVAALVIASGVLGRHPTPQAITARLEATARHLGPAGRNRYYGYGLVDAGAATAPAPVPAPATAP